MLPALLPQPTLSAIILLEDKVQLQKQLLKCLPMAFLCPEITPKRSENA